MTLKLFSDLFDALAKVDGGLKVTVYVPKTEKYKLAVEIRKELYVPRTTTNQLEH